MDIADEFTGDIAEKIEKQLEKREVGHSTRLLYDSAIAAFVKEFVQQYFQLREEEMNGGWALS